ncbi:WGxxGxxG family protein [Paenibacillaceae bacterium WGS1546]|uniref:WGxxGxxG family protein n=1 Tax=Cohnella sp. WGS1546 TaxID=3366810 RepID=UPI00372D0E92
MRKRIISGLWVAGVAVMLTVPAYAHTTTDGGNGGLGNGMGTYRTGTHAGIGTHANGKGMQGVHGAGRAPNYDVSVYGTGTGSQFRNVNPGTPPGAAGGNAGFGVRTNTDGAYRTTAAAPARGGGWGWLGLLGLLGLAGMRNRQPQGDRK